MHEFHTRVLDNLQEKKISNIRKDQFLTYILPNTISNLSRPKSLYDIISPYDLLDVV